MIHIHRYMIIEIRDFAYSDSLIVMRCFKCYKTKEKIIKMKAIDANIKYGSQKDNEFIRLNKIYNKK